MTEEECTENLHLSKEVGFIFQPGGKGEVNLKKNLTAISERFGFEIIKKSNEI